jgi:hypothetical protein
MTAINSSKPEGPTQDMVYGMYMRIKKSLPGASSE